MQSIQSITSTCPDSPAPDQSLGSKLSPKDNQSHSEQPGKGGKELRDLSQGDPILLIKAASSQGLDNLSCCRLFTAVEFNTPMNKAS